MTIACVETGYPAGRVTVLSWPGRQRLLQAQFREAWLSLWLRQSCCHPWDTGFASTQNVNKHSGATEAFTQVSSKDKLMPRMWNVCRLGEASIGEKPCGLQLDTSAEVGLPKAPGAHVKLPCVPDDRLIFCWVTVLLWFDPSFP